MDSSRLRKPGRRPFGINPGRRARYGDSTQDCGIRGFPPRHGRGRAQEHGRRSGSSAARRGTGTSRRRAQTTVGAGCKADLPGSTRLKHAGTTALLFRRVRPVLPAKGLLQRSTGRWAGPVSQSFGLNGPVWCASLIRYQIKWGGGTPVSTPAEAIREELMANNPEYQHLREEHTRYASQLNQLAAK